MKNPENKKDLQKLLGVINYVRDFIPKLAEITAPLRELLKKNVIFQWENSHSEAVNKIKNILVSNTVLKNFDTKKQITIQTDACQEGLGCCLLQDNLPVTLRFTELERC